MQQLNLHIVYGALKCPRGGMPPPLASISASRPMFADDALGSALADSNRRLVCEGACAAGEASTAAFNCDVADSNN